MQKKDDDMKSKRCRECGQTKSLDEFYVHVEMGDGHLNKCKVCVKERTRLYRIANPERVAVIDKTKYEKAKMNPEFRLQRLRYQKTKRTSEIYRAHNFVKRHLRSVKPDFCEQCHERKAEHAHHPNYKNPLNVTWLCIRCHQRLHHLPNAEVSI